MSGVVICDNGTGYIKCGLVPSNIPTFNFPCVVGRPALRATVKKETEHIKDLMFGWDASKYRSYLSLNYPMQCGQVRDWSDMSLVYDYTFGSECLDINCSTHKILLTEPASNPLKNREKTVELMLEQFGFNGVYIGMQAIMTLFSQGKYTGVVLDSGDGVTHVCPVYEGYTIAKGVDRLNVAGRNVSIQLTKLLQERGHNFDSSADFQTIGEMKESICYVAGDLEKELKLARETTFVNERFELPDGRRIFLNEERFMSTEILFHPELVDVEKKGFPDMVLSSILKCDIDVRPHLFRDVYLSGGTTMFPGLPSRVEKDIRKLTSGKFKCPININDPPYRKHLVYQGASVLGSVIKDQDQLWMNKRNYEEHGAGYIHTLCSK